MTIERDRARRITKISQDGYVKSLLEKFGGGALKLAETPGSEDMFEIDPESPDLDEREKKYFISLIMSLMYLARFTFGQILVYVNFLSTRLSKPKVQDMKKAKRILRYLAGAKDHGLYLGGDKIDCRIWVDTSHGVHADGKGQGCIIISLGLGPVFVRSYKLRVTGLSSTEDEVVGVCEHCWKASDSPNSSRRLSTKTTSPLWRCTYRAAASAGASISLFVDATSKNIWTTGSSPSSIAPRKTC